MEERHYATVGEALLRTLEEGLGAAFAPLVRVAWTEVYGFIARTMIDAARAAGARPETAAA